MSGDALTADLPTAKKRRPLGLSPWSISVLLLVLLIALPVFVIAANFFTGTGPEWEHVRENLLPKYLKNSAILVLSVSLLSILFGVPTAWLVSNFHFPGRRFFEWALILPLAFPTYVAAFAYSDVFDELLPKLIWIRLEHGFETFRTVQDWLRYGIVSLILASVLYPYVYLSARVSFALQGRSSIEASRTLGHGNFSTFFRVALPMARPALVAGIALVIMEVLNDYGAVAFFNIHTFTVGIFRTWFSLGDPASAIRLASGLLLFIFVLLMAERASRGRRRFAEQNNRTLRRSEEQTGKLGSAFAITLCLIPLALGFAIPVWRLSRWTLQSWKKVISPDFIELTIRSVGLALGTAAVTVAVALLFVYARRLHHTVWLRSTVQIGTLGYAIPGAIVALGVLIPFGWFDNTLDAFARDRFNTSTGLILSGTLFAVGFAYLSRFLAVAYQPLSSATTRTCGHLDEASRCLGKRPLTTLFRINIPLLRGSLLAAGMLVFVDILKELPLTIILRPANFETLATKAYSLASENRIPECAVPSLLIVVVGMLGLIPLNRLMKGSD